MPRPKKGDAALRRIKTYIQEKGWTQNKAVDRSTGAVCLSYACWDAAAITQYERAIAERRLEHTIGHSTLPSWNDKSGRTVEEVYALIDRTIEEG